MKNLTKENKDLIRRLIVLASVADKVTIKGRRTIARSAAMLVKRLEVES
jgi:hypothetical protein